MLERMSARVKTSRAYDASGRRARAAAQYDETLQVARRLFLARGYAATTVAAIARGAEVSEATVFKSYGGKAGLVRELCRRALAGAGTVPAEERSDALRDADDPRAVIEGWSRLLVEVSPRVSPLLLLLRDAAGTDEEAAALHDELEAARLARMTDNAEAIARHLRRGVDVGTARDVLWFCTSPELHDLLAVRRGWSPEQVRGFVASTMTAALV
jgi:AcrR family transcriptional regulator